MLDLLASATAFTAIVAVLLFALAGLTVVPFVVACGMAERRGFAPTRWGAVALVASSLGLLLCLVLVTRTALPWPVGVLPVVLTWAAPGVLWLLEGTEQALGGRAGRHE